MIGRVPNSILGKLVFASGLVWILFGAAILVALLNGLLPHSRSQPADVLIVPVFDILWFGTDLTIDWVHHMGVFVGSCLCMGTGLAICIFLAPKFKQPI